MNIKTITIKNVRGINLKKVTLNMIPNKPSILVAPNGAGKSSFAFAFQWLNRLRIKLNEEDAYNNDVNNKPELIIETDEADESSIETANITVELTTETTTTTTTTKATNKLTTTTEAYLTVVYITDTGEKYHRSSCSSLRKSKHSINISDAIAQGYTPCARCNP